MPHVPAHADDLVVDLLEAARCLEKLTADEIRGFCEMLPPSFASLLTPTVRPKLGKQAVNEAQAADGALCDLCGND